MALKNGSSAGIDLREMIELVAAFEAQNTVRITIRAYLTMWRGSRDLEWVAEAFPSQSPSPGQQPLAYAKCRCGELRLASMEAVLTHLLYALDFQLAEAEWAKSKPEANSTRHT